jgi:hypothetical protein
MLVSGIVLPGSHMRNSCHIDRGVSCPPCTAKNPPAWSVSPFLAREAATVPSWHLNQLYPM